jgi:hypothetical protein
LGVEARDAPEPVEVFLDLLNSRKFGVVTGLVPAPNGVKTESYPKRGFRSRLLG